MDIFFLAFQIAQTLRGVTLRVHVDQEGFLFQSGKVRSKVDCCSGFTHATFLVTNSYYFTHRFL